MNNNMIRNSVPDSLPHLPKLIGSKTTRVITKHFTNCPLYMDGDSFVLLTWLIYQSKNDNTIKYSTHLLNRYRSSLLLAGEHYKSELNLYKSIPKIRLVFKYLIETGYILPNYQPDVFTINPMLTYRDEYIRKDEYSRLCDFYQAVQFGTGGDVREIGKELSEIVNKRIKEKKTKKSHD